MLLCSYCRQWDYMGFPSLCFRILEQRIMTDFLDRDQENNTLVKPHTRTTKRLHVLLFGTKDYLIRWVKNRTLVIWTIRLTIVSNRYLCTTALYYLTEGTDI